MTKKISQRERSIFECGIKLGFVFHQFIGTPVSLKSKASLEKAIGEAVKNQPYVESAAVAIDEKKLKKIKNRFGYAALSEEMLAASVTTRVGDWRCEGELKFVHGYPLMSVKRVQREKRYANSSAK